MTERRMHNVSLEVRPCGFVHPAHQPHVYHIDTGRTDRYHWCPGFMPNVGAEPEVPAAQE